MGNPTNIINPGRLFLTESNLIALNKSPLGGQFFSNNFLQHSETHPTKNDEEDCSICEESDKYIELLRVKDKSYLKEKLSFLEKEKRFVRMKLGSERNNLESLEMKHRQLKHDVFVLRKRVQKIQRTIHLIDNNMDDHSVIMFEAKTSYVNLQSALSKVGVAQYGE